MLPKAPKSIWSACLPCMIFYLFIYLFLIIFAVASKSNKREKDRNRDLKDFFFILFHFY